MYAFFTTMFNTPILKSGCSYKANLLLQVDNIQEDLLAPLTYKQEEMEVSMLEIDLEIEELERKIRIDLELQHASDIVKLQATYGVQYKEDHNFMSL